MNITRILMIQKYGYVGTTGFRTEKKSALIKVYRYVDYSGNPALRRTSKVRFLSALSL
jgi:hypothetical protein